MGDDPVAVGRREGQAADGVAERQHRDVGFQPAVRSSRDGPLDLAGQCRRAGWPSLDWPSLGWPGLIQRTSELTRVSRA